MMEGEQASPLEREHTLSVLLPGGLEETATVHGRQPVMDLLVTLCASYHLNPSDYTAEFLSANKNNISFKPHAPVGSLEAERVVLKPRKGEEKDHKPYMPEATVRLLVNYSETHKTVVRVSPRVPLEMLLPIVCDKCEFNLETTVLLRDCLSTEPLDMGRTLNYHGLREVFAKDLSMVPAASVPAEVIPCPPTQEFTDQPKKLNKQKENSGFLSFFRWKKQKNESDIAAAGRQEVVVMNPPSVLSTDSAPAQRSTKRRAPLPPMAVSQSIPNFGNWDPQRQQISGESTLRRTKRRAPSPPCTETLQGLQVPADVNGTSHSLQEFKDFQPPTQSSSSSPTSSSPPPLEPQSLSSSSITSFAVSCEVTATHQANDKDNASTDARHALAKILTSSLSNGVCARWLKTSATLPTPIEDASSQECQDNASVRTTTEEEQEPVELQLNGLPTITVVPLSSREPYEEGVIQNVPELGLESMEPIQTDETEEAEEAAVTKADVKAEARGDRLTETEVEAEVAALQDLSCPHGSLTDHFPLTACLKVADSDYMTYPLHFPDSKRPCDQHTSLSAIIVEGQGEDEKPEIELELSLVHGCVEELAGGNKSNAVQEPLYDVKLSGERATLLEPVSGNIEPEEPAQDEGPGSSEEPVGNEEQALHEEVASENESADSDEPAKDEGTISSEDIARKGELVHHEVTNAPKSLKEPPGGEEPPGHKEPASSEEPEGYEEHASNVAPISNTKPSCLSKPLGNSTKVDRDETSYSDKDAPVSSEEPTREEPACHENPTCYIDATEQQEIESHEEPACGEDSAGHEQLADEEPVGYEGPVSNAELAGNKELKAKETDQTNTLSNDTVVEEEDEDNFPPPPSPICFNEDGLREESTAHWSSSSSSSSSSLRSHSPISTGQIHPSSSASTKPNAVASRFAQAVALAVQRSHHQSPETDLDAQAAHNLQCALPVESRSTYQYGA